MTRNLFAQVQMDELATKVDEFCAAGWVVVSHAVYFLESRLRGAGGEATRRIMMVSLHMTKDVAA